MDLTKDYGSHSRNDCDSTLRPLCVLSGASSGQDTRKRLLLWMRRALILGSMYKTAVSVWYEGNMYPEMNSPDTYRLVTSTWVTWAKPGELLWEIIEGISVLQSIRAVHLNTLCWFLLSFVTSLCVYVLHQPREVMFHQSKPEDI